MSMIMLRCSRASSTVGRQLLVVRKEDLGQVGPDGAGASGRRARWCARWRGPSRADEDASKQLVREAADVVLARERRRRGRGSNRTFCCQVNVLKALPESDADDLTALDELDELAMAGPGSMPLNGIPIGNMDE
jgi:hypothetical protein